ncbi:MAG: hypothetical protein JNL05_00600 [Flavobacteriales bacterium]|nr:hypothetical protein [Flavobacteriales bacterium]
MWLRHTVWELLQGTKALAEERTRHTCRPIDAPLVLHGVVYPHRWHVTVVTHAGMPVAAMERFGPAERNTIARLVVDLFRADPRRVIGINELAHGPYRYSIVIRSMEPMDAKPGPGQRWAAHVDARMLAPAPEQA